MYYLPMDALVFVSPAGLPAKTFLDCLYLEQEGAILRNARATTRCRDEITEKMRDHPATSAAIPASARRQNICLRVWPTGSRLLKLDRHRKEIVVRAQHLGLPAVAREVIVQRTELVQHVAKFVEDYNCTCGQNRIKLGEAIKSR
jgi:hypothetical protein